MNDHEKLQIDGQHCKMEQHYKVPCLYLVCMFTHCYNQLYQTPLETRVSCKTANLDFQLTLLLPADFVIASCKVHN